MLAKRSFFLLLVLVLGCSAQAPDATLKRRVEHGIRTQYNLPAFVKVTVGERKPSEMPGFDALTVTIASPDRSSIHEFLISKDNKTLVNMTRIDVSVDPEKLREQVAARIKLEGRPFLGPKDAKVTIVNYDDFQCPFCTRMHNTLMDGIVKHYGELVKIVYKDFPLEAIHPWAVRSAVNANCLAAQSNPAYWEYANYLHRSLPEISAAARDPKNIGSRTLVLDNPALETARNHKLDVARVEACLKAQDESAVRQSMQEAEELGVEATPTLFINGEKVSGAIPEQQLRAILDRALLAAGVQPPAAQTPAAAAKPASNK